VITALKRLLRTQAIFEEGTLATIRLENLTKVYTGASQTVALDHLSLTIPDGKTLAVIGPSGCGKSTLLRAIAGLVDYEGDVYYDDGLMNTTPVKDRYIGMVFQNYALYPHFYGHGNLSFFFRVHKAPDAEIAERIRITSEIMGIGFDDLLRRKPGTLSGGQQQRVAIARAIVRRPQLFLLDEPLSNLDAKLRVQTRVEIRKLLNRFQITAVYVTHDQVEAIALGDIIAVMRAGQIVQVGAYQELSRNPCHAFVAGFLGLPPMNLLPGVVRGGVVDLGGFTAPLPPSIVRQTRQGQAIYLGFHADDAVVAPDFSGERGGLHWRGVVEVVEPDFGRRRQLAYIGAGSQHYRAAAAPETALHQGYEVGIHLPVEALYFFDRESEARIDDEEATESA